MDSDAVPDGHAESITDHRALQAAFIGLASTKLARTAHWLKIHDRQPFHVARRRSALRS